jgi:uncharacterized phage protein (TIGR02218 family)
MRTLRLEEQYPIVVTCSFNNSFTELADGRQQLVVGWEQPLLGYDLSKTILSEAKLKYLVQFFDEVSADVFLYKDPADYLCTSFAYEPKPGVATWGQLFPVSGTEWQLCKVYQAGGYRSIRPISRPETEGLVINSSAAYLLDDATGRVYFTTEVNEPEIFWEGSFLVPVTLENQDWSHKIESNEPKFSLPEFRLKEVREIVNSFRTQALPQYLDANLDLDLIVGSIITYDKKISNVFADNGWYKDLPLWELPRVKISTAKKTIADHDDVEAAIALYRVSCGGAIGFNYQDKTVRIEKSPLVIDVDSEFNFGIGTLELIQTNEVFALDKIDAETYIVPILQSGVEPTEIFLALIQFRALLKHRIFGDNEELTAKYFQEAEVTAAADDQRWTSWLARDYRQDLGAPDKVAFIVFLNSQSSFYDTYGNFTPEYRDALLNFAPIHRSKDSFAAVFYAPGALLELQDYLKNSYAQDGDNLYSFKRYGILIRPDIPVDLSAESYLADMSRTLTDFQDLEEEKSVNFVARCWELEQKAIPPSFTDLKQNFPNQLFLPFKPNIADDDFLAYLFWVTGDPSDFNYWRTLLPVKGRNIKLRKVSQQRNSIDDLMYYTYFVYVDVELTGGVQSPIVRISQFEYNDLTFADFTGRNAYYKTSTKKSLAVSDLASGFQTPNVVPLQRIASGERLPVYFRTVKDRRTSYVIRAFYGNGQICQTDVTSSVEDPVTDIQLYFDYNQVTRAWSYNLSVIANGVRTDGLALFDGFQSISEDFAPLGLYNFMVSPVGAWSYDEDKLEEDVTIIEATNAPIQKVGFTNHDVAIVFNDTEFLPSYGGNAQARVHNGDLESSNNTETNFILRDLFNYEDLLDGVWTGAKFTEWLVDWNNPAIRFKLATGHIGRITTESSHNGGISCKLEMRSLLALLQQKNYFLTVEHCPKTFGKEGRGNCRKNLFGLIDQLEVIDIVDPLHFTTNSTRTQDDFYGQVTFLTGKRQNVARMVDAYSPVTKNIRLRSSISGLAVGDKLNAIARCDKTLKACLEFDNAANFGGFWHVPGIDKVARTDR